MQAPETLMDGSKLKGRNRRLFYEWSKLHRHISARTDIDYRISRTNRDGLPVGYLIEYRLTSICAVEQMDKLDEEGAVNTPVFHHGFLMSIELPEAYPCVDAGPQFQFLTADLQGNPIEHPWHPNIRYFGNFAGRVCLNMTDTYTDLIWGVERVAHYLRYDLYNAVPEPPYPEDVRVAEWVRRQGEPNGWIFFDQPSADEVKQDIQK